MNSINWPRSQLWLHSSVGRAEVTGSNPVEALIFFFRLLLSNCLNWKIYCDDHSSLSSTTAVQKWIISYILHIIAVFCLQNLICLSDQVFIDPTFFGIFVCGPLQSLVVNVCTERIVYREQEWMAHGGGGGSTCLLSMSSGLGLTNPCHAKCLSISDSSTTGAYIHYERTFQDIYSIFISCFCFLFFFCFSTHYYSSPKSKTLIYWKANTLGKEDIITDGW